MKSKGSNPIEGFSTVAREFFGWGAEIEVFEQGQPEVDRTTIEQAAALAQSRALDVVIGVEGGANLDFCKAVALLVKFPGPL